MPPRVSVSTEHTGVPMPPGPSIIRRRTRALCSSIILIFLLMFLGEVGAICLAMKASQTTSDVKSIDKYCSRVVKMARHSPETSRCFADVADPRAEGIADWREFSSQEALNGSETYDQAQVWFRGAALILARTYSSSPSGDWALYTDYYFREGGTVARVDSELRTFYGNVVVRRHTYYDDSGKNLTEMVEYRDLHTGKITTAAGPEGTGFLDHP